MHSPRLRLAFVLLLFAMVLAAMVTLQNRRPRPGSSAQGPVDRLESYYREYEGGGSCKWRQPMGAPPDPFPTLLLVALLAYPAVLGAAVGFLRSLSSAGSGRARRVPALGLAAAGLVLIWLIRLGFVSAALELC
jgi:hypothetical protein